MKSAPIKPLISTSDLDKIDVCIGTILAVKDVAHSDSHMEPHLSATLSCCTIQEFCNRNSFQQFQELARAELRCKSPRMSLHGSAPRRRGSLVEEDSTQRVVD